MKELLIANYKRYKGSKINIKGAQFSVEKLTFSEKWVNKHKGHN